LPKKELKINREKMTGLAVLGFIQSGFIQFLNKTRVPG
jgi:hypothetical protein